MSAESRRKPSGIAKWPEDERPRERLLTRGPHALTEAELVGIILRVGVEGKNAVELGRDLLEHFGSLQAMMAAPLAEWFTIKGLGQAKIAQLQAALELGRRAANPTIREDTIIKSTRQAADYFSARLREPRAIRGQDKLGGPETFSMLMLDFDYDGEVFDLDAAFYAAELQADEWRAWFPAEGIGAQVMAVFTDIYGNEAREVIPREKFGEDLEDLSGLALRRVSHASQRRPPTFSQRRPGPQGQPGGESQPLG